jgi:hypothetical protein
MSTRPFGLHCARTERRTFSNEHEAFRAPLRTNRKEDFLLATPEERVAVLEKCGVVPMYRLRLSRLKKEMARTFSTKHQGPQGVRQSLKSSGRMLRKKATIAS